MLTIDKIWNENLAIHSQERSAKLYKFYGNNHNTMSSNEFARYYLLRSLGYDRCTAWSEAKLRR